jgi:hypothetical protein
VAAFFPAAGYRYDDYGGLTSVGNYGAYYTSSPYGSAAYDVDLTSSTVLPAGNGSSRAHAQSVRCVKEFILVCYL